MGETLEQVAPDESVYRRVPVKSGYYRPADQYLSAKAFNPTANDITGISLSRARHFAHPKEAAAAGYDGVDYWIIEFRVADIAHAGATVVCDDATDLSHAIIPELRNDQLKTARADELMDAIRRLPRIVHGPFPGSKPRPAK